MAKRVATYKGFTIKETSPLDNTEYKYWIVKNGIVEWESDSVADCKEWIDCY